MRHTKESKALAQGWIPNVIDGLPIENSAEFSCAYSTVIISGSLEKLLTGTKYNLSTGLNELLPKDERKTQIQVMREFVKKYRKPLLFTGKGGGEGVLTKAQLEKFHKNGKYLDITWLMDTETSHLKTYMVDLFKLEVVDESVPRRTRRKSTKA